MRVSARSLGWYHIAGAVVGGAYSVWAWAHGASLFGNSLELGAIPFGLAFAAGIRLLRSSPRARQLAYITQLLQIPIVILPALTWRFTAGVEASITLTAKGLYLFGGVAAAWLVGRGNLGGLTPTLGINFAPIVVLVLLACSTTTMVRPTMEPVSPPSA
jgi:hypothetical protein